MPPKHKTAVQIEQERTNILDVALHIIAERGYSNLTMRLLATKCNMSATKIYYYFINKEAVYFNVVERGFQIILDDVSLAYCKGKDEKERFSNVCQAIFDFGFKNPFYYEIMFSERTPRRMDFTEGPLLEIAEREKKVGLSFYEFWKKSILEFAVVSKKDFGDYKVICMLSLVHGAINFYHSKNLQEIGIDYEILCDEIISSLIAYFE